MKLHRGLMSISDFAAYCGTTRQTLQYYDRIGLMEPIKVGEQGYRYYHPLQAHEVRMIRSFQGSGSSLEELREILNSTSIDALQDWITLKQEAMAAEMKRLNREFIYLSRYREFLEIAKHNPRQDLVLISGKLPAIHLTGQFIVQIAVLIVSDQVGGQGHIQLERGQFRGEDGKAVLPDDHAQIPAIVPMYVEGPRIVDVFQFSRAAGRDGIRIVLAHLPEPDAGTGGVLLPEELQPFLWYFSHTHISIFIVGPCGL